MKDVRRGIQVYISRRLEELREKSSKLLQVSNLIFARLLGR
jgi:hypothetical protein